MRWLAEDMTRWLRQWSLRIEAGYTAIDAELDGQKELCLEEGSEELRAAFVTLTWLEWKMAARAETAALRVMRRLHVAALRAAVAMVRAETALSRMPDADGVGQARRIRAPPDRSPHQRGCKRQLFGGARTSTPKRSPAATVATRRRPQLALMKRWVDDMVPLAELDDGADAHLHTSEWATNCVTQALFGVLTRRVEAEADDA